MTESEGQAPTCRKLQAPDPETDSGPVGFIGGGVVSPGSEWAGYAPAAFAAMSVRCWEPSRRMRPTAV